MTEQEAASWLRRSVHTLRRWRSQGKGPRYIKMQGETRKGKGRGGFVVYRLEDLIEFAKELTVQTCNIAVTTGGDQ